MSNHTRFGKSSWREFTADDLQVIEKEREKNKEHIVQVKKAFPNAQYGLVCRACTKPNTASVDFCTGCSFPCTPDDIEKLPDNIFLEMINGRDTGTKVFYRDENFLCFDDKFGCSDNHIDVIPVEVIEDISFLNKSHIPMLEKLYELGQREFKNRNVKLPEGKTLEEYTFAGYNHPVSVKHLHLHMVLPPFKHAKVMLYPRWHPHKKVIQDLETHGRVILYSEKPNEQEGEEDRRTAMTAHNTMSDNKFDV
ncbi:histidine triad nucleotide-binding protein [Acrasis kona]|uniref:Histidine triad nucleotide-binding protein n=1 Tax=Acrasis kona TaxID=1008807 RepID=A0AAW2YVZ3_9EUKA